MIQVEAPFIADRFRLERPLGAGGMSVVYAAFDITDNDHPVALKVQRHADASTTLRFLREAEILAGVRVPGIVGYHGHGQLSDGRVWLALEWLAGETLQQRLSRGPLAPVEALALAERVAHSLELLHARGVVHRDIKPENLFLRGGEPRDVCLLDLGIARLMAPGRRTTQFGMVIGTPAYMAPEQARGAADLDHRADLYALGSVLYECLTGEPAWPGQNALAIMVKLLVEAPPRLAQSRPSMAGPLDALVTRLMSRHPDARPTSAEDAAAELASLGANLPAHLAGPVAITAGALGPSTTRPPVEEPSAAEVRICTLLLVGSAVGSSLPGESIADQGRARLDAMLGENEAQAIVLADGSLLVRFEGSGMPTDRATRAARCAMALAAHLSTASVVVATGALRVRVETPNAPPLGRVIERAAEALRSTPPGTVRLDATTSWLLDARFVLAEPMPGEFGERILLGEIEPLSRGRLVGGRLSPFVGRERELLILAAWLRETLQTRKARCAVVQGAPGVGKTRLRDEFLGRWMATRSEVQVVSGACPERGGHGAGLRDIVQRALGIGTTEPVEFRRNRLREWLGLSLSVETVERATPFLAELMGLGGGSPDENLRLQAVRRAPEEMAEAVARAVTDAFRGLLDMGPLLLVLDDGQWIDPGTEAILQRVVASLAGQPLFWLTFQRGPRAPGPQPRGQGAVATAELVLMPLSDAAADRLVTAMLGGPPESRMPLVRRAGGNPYYLEELIRAAADGNREALPETVLAMVQARVAVSLPREKRVLRAASVFGLAFSRAGLQSLMPDLWPPELDEALLALAEAELVDESEPGWRFAQEAIREATYAMLTPEDRQRNHARAAEFLRTQAPGSSWQIAEHLVAAGQVSAAAVHFVDAAELSLERNDLAGAAEMARRGLAVCDGRDVPDQAVGTLHQILAHVAGWRGRRNELVSHAEQALARLEPGTRSWYRVVSDWIVVQSAQEVAGAHARLETLVSTARHAARARRAEDCAEAAICLCRVASRISERGATEHTEAMFQIAFELGRDPALPPPAGAIVQRTIAARAWRRGDLGMVCAALRRALYEFESYGFERLASGVRGNLGAACNEIGHYDQALTLLDATVREASRIGLVRVEAVAWHNLGHTLFRVGRFEEAEEAELTALAHFDAQGDALMAGAARCYLARIHTHQGRPAQAESEARRAALALAAEAVPLYVLAQAALSEALLAQGRADEACRAAADGEVAASTLEALGEGEILFAVIHGEALDAVGRQTEAAQRFTRARDAVERRALELDDSEDRAAWLTAVAENAQALTRWRELAR